MKKVTIGNVEYDSYVTVAEADIYANGSIAGDDWEATTADDKGRSLVEATRLLERQRWLPPFDDRATRLADARVTTAAIEIAILVAGGAVDLLTAGSTNDLIKRLRAGSVEIEYSGKSSAAQRFPSHIAELLSGLVAGTGAMPAGLALGGALSFGTGALSDNGRSYGVTRG